MAIPNIIFIIPYRNRIYLKTHFEIYMRHILEDLDKDSYEIYFVHQCDPRPFNRGAMKNIGFLAMRDKYPNNYKDINFVFNDIDTMPAMKNYLKYETTVGTIKHFYGFKFALGGIFSIKGCDFEKIRGFPNYWAWGLEDNDILHRVKQHNLQIDYSQFHEFANDKIIQLPYNYTRIISKQQTWRAGVDSIEGLGHIKNLKYIIENEYINVKNFITSVNPHNDNYVSVVADGKIPRDTNFIPSDAVRAPNFKGGVMKKNNNDGSKFQNNNLQQNNNHNHNIQQNKIEKFKLF